jgi:hypothetical protein
MNWFDLIISILCLSSILLYIFGPKNKKEEEVEELADTVLNVLRYIPQMLRILIFIRKQQHHQAIASQYINLNSQSDHISLLARATENEDSENEEAQELSDKINIASDSDSESDNEIIHMA